jgi:hypothetical protein
MSRSNTTAQRRMIRHGHGLVTSAGICCNVAIASNSRARLESTPLGLRPETACVASTNIKDRSTGARQVKCAVSPVAAIRTGLEIAQAPLVKPANSSADRGLSGSATRVRKRRHAIHVALRSIEEAPIAALDAQSLFLLSPLFRTQSPVRLKPSGVRLPPPAPCLAVGCGHRFIRPSERRKACCPRVYPSRRSRHSTRCEPGARSYGLRDSATSARRSRARSARCGA